MPRRAHKERSDGAGIVVAPDKENTFVPPNQLASRDPRKTTVEDYNEPNAEEAPIIVPVLSPAERMASRLLEARRRGIQGLVLVSSKDQDDIVPVSALSPSENEIEDDHQTLDLTIGGDVDPICLDNDAAARALSAADEELRKFFHPQMVGTDPQASSAETFTSTNRKSPPPDPQASSAETFTSTNRKSPPPDEAFPSDSGSLHVVVPPSNLRRVPDESNDDQDNDQELQEVPAPPNDPGGFLVKVFSPVAEEVELLLNTEARNQIAASSQVNTIDESPAIVIKAPNKDSVKSQEESMLLLDKRAGVVIAELPEVNRSDETIEVINKSSSNCVTLLADQSSTNGSSSDEEDDMEDQDTWSAATSRNDTNCFVEVFSPLAEEVRLLINLGAKKQIPKLPEGNEIDESNVIHNTRTSEDGPILLPSVQSSRHANKESVKMAVPSDAAPAASAHHELAMTEETHLHTARNSGELCCFAGPVSTLLEDHLADINDDSRIASSRADERKVLNVAIDDDVLSHVTVKATNSSAAAKRVDEKPTSTLLACPGTSDEKCAAEMEADELSPCSGSALDGHLVISKAVECTSALGEETLKPAIEHGAPNPKDITTSLTGETPVMQTAGNATNDEAQDVDSIASREAVTTEPRNESNPESASELGGSTPQDIPTTPTSKQLEETTTGTVTDHQIQGAESDALTEAATSALLEETMERAIEHAVQNRKDVTTASTNETLEMATAVTVIDEQGQDIESAVTAAATAPSTLGEEVREESNREENTTSLTFVADHAQDDESDTSALREERNVGKATEHGAPTPNDGTSISVGVTHERATTVIVVDGETQDVESDSPSSATDPSTLRGEVTMEPTFEHGESNPNEISTVSTRTTFDVADTSDEAATCALKEEKNVEQMTEHGELNPNDITTSSTSKAIEPATTSAVIDQQGQEGQEGQEGQDSESDAPTEAVTSALREESQGEKSIEHGAPAPKESGSASVGMALESATAASVIVDEAQDVESDTSTEASMSALKKDAGSSLQSATELEESKTKFITTSPTNKAVEEASAAAAIRRSARRRFRNLNKRRRGITEGKEEHGKATAIDHCESIPNDITTSSTTNEC